MPGGTTNTSTYVRTSTMGLLGHRGSFYLLFFVPFLCVCVFSMKNISARYMYSYEAKPVFGPQNAELLLWLLWLPHFASHL